MAEREGEKFNRLTELQELNVTFYLDPEFDLDNPFNGRNLLEELYQCTMMIDGERMEMNGVLLELQDGKAVQIHP